MPALAMTTLRVNFDEWSRYFVLVQIQKSVNLFIIIYSCLNTKTDFIYKARNTFQAFQAVLFVNLRVHSGDFKSIFKAKYLEFSAVSAFSSCVCLKPLPCIESLMLSLLAGFVSDLTFFGFSDIFEISDIYQGQF